MHDEDPAADRHLERIGAALAGLAPEQSERLVRMVELGAMICLVEEAAAGRGFGGSVLTEGARGEVSRRGRAARAPAKTHAGAS